MATDENAFTLGSVNLDSLKEVLSRLADAFPFVDETSARAFRDQIESLHAAGDPHEVSVAPDKDAEIAALRAQLAEAEAKAASN